MGWTVRGSNPGRGEGFYNFQNVDTGFVGHDGYRYCDPDERAGRGGEGDRVSCLLLPVPRLRTGGALPPSRCMAWTEATLVFRLPLAVCFTGVMCIFVAAEAALGVRGSRADHDRAGSRVSVSRLVCYRKH
jgi:hypothetical protein